MLDPGRQLPTHPVDQAVLVGADVVHGDLGEASLVEFGDLLQPRVTNPRPPSTMPGTWTGPERARPRVSVFAPGCRGPRRARAAAASCTSDPPPRSSPRGRRRSAARASRP